MVKFSPAYGSGFYFKQKIKNIMKTKYIKVSVSDRIPEKEGLYCTNLGTLLFYKNSEGLESFKSLRNEEVISKSRIDFWLEEVPDYEEEMKDLLEQIYLETPNYLQISTDTRKEIEELLTKQKTES